MAERSTLLRGLATLSGRIVPRWWTAPEGTHVVCLGSDEPGYTGRFVNGDIIEAATTGTVAVDTAAIIRAHIRGPRADLPAGWSWVFGGVVRNGVGVVTSFEVPIDPHTEFDMVDFALPLMVADAPIEVRYFIRAVNGASTDAAELEIPAVYLDVFVAEPISAGVGIFNRYPAPGQFEVARSNAVGFHLISTNGTAPSVAATTVEVNGVGVMSGGVALGGWALSTTAYTARGVRVTLTPPAPFASQELVTVRVRTTLGVVVLDETWSFTTTDDTAPVVLEATSPSHYTFRVRFDEPVTMESPTGSADALNPANWSIVPLTAPAVTLNVVGVTAVSPYMVEIATDIPVTRAAEYRITAANITDPLGNVITAPTNTATCIGYECAVPEGRRFELWRMVADIDRRRDQTQDLYKFLAMLQEPLDLLLCDIDRWTDIIDVDAAEERYVDQMLIGLGNPFEFDLDVVDKRRLVRVLVGIYKQKGTGPGIINVIRFFLGLEVTIDAYNMTGWILGADELGIGSILAPTEQFARYSFTVTSPVVLTDEQRRRIRDLVGYMKPAHTHFVELIEPTIPTVINHVELGLSRLGDGEWRLH